MLPSCTSFLPPGSFRKRRIILSAHIGTHEPDTNSWCDTAFTTRSQSHHQVAQTITSLTHAGKFIPFARTGTEGLCNRSHWLRNSAQQGKGSSVVTAHHTSGSAIRVPAKIFGMGASVHRNRLVGCENKDILNLCHSFLPGSGQIKASL